METLPSERPGGGVPLREVCVSVRCPALPMAMGGNGSGCFPSLSVVIIVVPGAGGIFSHELLSLDNHLKNICKERKVRSLSLP